MPASQPFICKPNNSEPEHPTPPLLNSHTPSGYPSALNHPGPSTRQPGVPPEPWSLLKVLKLNNPKLRTLPLPFLPHEKHNKVFGPGFFLSPDRPWFFLTGPCMAWFTPPLGKCKQYILSKAVVSMSVIFLYLIKMQSWVHFTTT